MPPELKVLIVDDHLVVREGLRSMLQSDPTIIVVGEAGTGEEAIELAQQLQPEVVLMDIQLPTMSGIEATRRIKAALPSPAIILLTMYDSNMYVVEGIRAGAAGYLTKDCSRELLCHTVNAVVDGGSMVTATLLRHAFQGLERKHGPQNEDSPLTERLTSREVEVLRLVARGYHNKAIASELHLAEVTVKKHVQNIIGKMGTSDRTQAAIVAFRLGLVD